eukprot:11501-Pelagococcus_subviridis.AAC.1
MERPSGARDAPVRGAGTRNVNRRDIGGPRRRDAAESVGGGERERGRGVDDDVGGGGGGG